MCGIAHRLLFIMKDVVSHVVGMVTWIDQGSNIEPLRCQVKYYFNFRVETGILTYHKLQIFELFKHK